MASHDDSRWGRLVSATQEEVELLATTGLELRELGITLPHPQLALSQVANELEGTFPASLEALITLPKLRFLRLGDWPLAPAGFFECPNGLLPGSAEEKELHTARYSKSMDQYATALMRHIVKAREHARLPRFAMLCFGDNAVGEQGSSRFVDVGLWCYIPGVESNIYGQSRQCALRVAKEEVTYAEGGENIFLDY